MLLLCYFLYYVFVTFHIAKATYNMTIGHVIIAIQWASLAGGDHDTLYTFSAKLAHHVRIERGNRQHCLVFVLAMSAKEECFAVCQFAFKSSATRGSKNGIVSIIWHRASWHLANGMPAIIVGETKVGWDTFHFFSNIAENMYDTYFELTRQGRESFLYKHY